MVFFQSFINDANRSQERLRQANSAEQAPLEKVGAAALPYLAEQAPDFLPDAEREVFVPAVSRHAEFEVSVSAAGEAVSSHAPTEPVFQKAVVDMAAQNSKPLIKSKTQHPPTSAFVDEDKSRTPQRKAKKFSEPVQQATPSLSLIAEDRQPAKEASALLAVESGSPLAALQEAKKPALPPPAVLLEPKHAGEAASQPAFQTVQKKPLGMAARRQPAQEASTAEERSRPLPQREEKEPPKPKPVVSPGEEAFALPEEEVFMLPGPVAKEERKPVLEEAGPPGYPQKAEAVSSKAPEKKFSPTPEATMQESEARLATTVEQARQALGLLSPLVAAAKKPTPTRETSEPQVHIGTIEVIVESAPVVQKKSTPNTGFSRNLSRSYQRRF